MLCHWAVVTSWRVDTVGALHVGAELRWTLRWHRRVQMSHSEGQTAIHLLESELAGPSSEQLLWPELEVLAI